MRLEQSIDIGAGQQRVWEVLTDIEKWAQRVETVDISELITPGHLAMGSRIRLKQPKVPEGIWGITVWEPPEYFELNQRSGGVTSVAGHRVESSGEGNSRLTLSVDMQGWLVPIIGLLSKNMTARYLTSEAQDMKRAAESPGA
jgi:carbon monoxide dehydrogenase subunit G